MSKAVLLPVQPYWVFLIIAKAMGWDYPQEKTVEVRKNYPKSEDWTRIVKLYCSKNKKSFSRIPKEYQPLMKELLGKVVGEFVCYKNTNLVHVGAMGSSKSELVIKNSDGSYSQLTEKRISKTCLSLQELENYSNGGNLYAWHISDLKIYDKPIELSKFFRKCDMLHCDNCKHIKYLRVNANEFDYDCEYYAGLIPITKAPQSWCYVEEV